MATINQFIKDCETLEDFFTKAKDQNVELHAIEVKTGQRGFKTLEAKADYALIRNYVDRRCEDVRSFVGVHPYGSSIAYTLER